MQLTDDRTVDATGTVGNRQVLHFADGQALAKATLVPEDGGKPVPVVWWEPGRAPPDGARVRVKGRIREFGGETELHADETTVERAGTANGPLAAIAAFYLACVEAEAANSLRLRPGGKGHIVLREGANERFYGGRLELCSAAAPPEGLRAVQWIRVAGKSEKGPGGRSRVNAAEAQRIVQAIVRGLPTYKGLECSIGIVTPYGAQARRIETLLSDVLDPDDLASLKVVTAHRFQGDERDIMYFSPVIDRSMAAREVRFAANPNLVNVALTRARRRLIIVGDPDACLAHDNALHGLANYALRLDASGFDSPLELALHEALLKRGVAARTGVVVGKHRLDLAVERDGVRLDIECDGAAFHTDHERDSARDHAVEAQGWTVMRFSGRALSRDLDACVDAIVDRLSAD